MPHAFYTGFRVFCEIVSSSLALKLLQDVYFDRSNLSELWRAPRRYNAARVFRVMGLLAALIQVITHVDFYGVFGIMDPRVVEILALAAVGLLSIAVYVTVYHELVVTLPFFGVHNFEHTHRLQAAVSVNCAIHCSFILTFFVENRVVFIALSVMMLMYTVMVFVVVNAMYFMIRRHHNQMRRAELRRYDGKSSHAWDETLRKWRVYVIILSTFFLTNTTVVLYTLVGVTSSISQNSVNFVLTPNEAPRVRSIVVPVVLLVLTCGVATRSASRPNASAPQASPDRRSNTKSPSPQKEAATFSSAGEAVGKSFSANEAAVP